MMLETLSSLLSPLHHGLHTYIDNRSLTFLLPVVNPSDDRHYGVHETLVVHTVLAMEMGGQRIVFAEHAEGVNQVVFIAKQSVDTSGILVGQPHKALFRHVAVLLHQCLVDIEFLDAVESGILKLLGSRHAVRLHRLGNL